MGDRANIKYMDGDGGTLYFYTHHGGAETVAGWLKAALGKRERWDDSQYLAGIIMREAARSDPDGTTGLGLTTDLWDNDHPLLVVDVNEQKVSFNGKVWTFDEYIVEEKLVPCEKCGTPTTGADTPAGRDARCIDCLGKALGFT